MGKKSQRRPVRYEKDQSGCMWGFISMFDFRHGHSTRKLITDGRHGGRHDVGSIHSENKFEMLSNLDEDYQGGLDDGESQIRTVTTGGYKPSMKKLIEEEMFVDQDMKKDDAKVKFKEPRVGLEDPQEIDSKRKKRSHKKNRDMDNHDLNSEAALKSEQPHNQHLRKYSKDNLDLDKIMEEFCHLKSACSVIHDRAGEVQAQTNQTCPIAENNARDAILGFVNQMIFNGKDLTEARKLLCSHELTEALHIISSDKELFVRFLQDPNSPQLKYVQELGNAQGNLSEQEPANLRQAAEIVNSKHRSFFRKKVKSQVKNPTSGNEITDTSNKIVILKPGPAGLQNCETENNNAPSLDFQGIAHDKGPSLRASSYFSLTQIKNRLKQAMRRERHGNSEGILKKLPAKQKNKGQGNKVIGKDNYGMKSPSKNHFFIEKITRPSSDVKKGDKASTVKDSEVMLERENGSHSKQGISNLYTEAKKHLCEMLDNGDDTMGISSRQIPKSLGRILSIPEYDFSPLGSPGRDWENHFVTAQTRFSGKEKIWEVGDNALSPEKATLTGCLNQAAKSPAKQSSICDQRSDDKVQEANSETNSLDDHLIHDVKSEIVCYPVKDEIIPEVDVKSTKATDVLGSSSEPADLIAGKDQNFDVSNISDDTIHSQCLNQDLSEENQPASSPPSSPSHSFITRKTEELESVTDVSGRPSPVSVLDTAFLEDDIRSGNTRFESIKIQIQPQQIQFEENDFSPLDQTSREKHYVEEDELILDYIKAALQASGLNRDQLWIKCLSSDQILDPSLFDQIDFFSSHLIHDQKLLFDCINEVLTEVCWQYLGISPWVSFVKPSIRPTPNMKKVILEVWQGVCWHFLCLPPSHTLEQIVRKDMARSGAWMDLRSDAEEVGVEMGEAILAELIEDTILCCVNESQESECSRLQLELKENESDINMQNSPDYFLSISSLVPLCEVKGS